MSFCKHNFRREMANSQYGLAPNYQLPIQKSSALLPCQMLVEDMANILATHI